MVKVSIEIDGREARYKDKTVGKEVSVLELIELCSNVLQGFGVSIDYDDLIAALEEKRDGDNENEFV